MDTDGLQGLQGLQALSTLQSGSVLGKRPADHLAEQYSESADQRRCGHRFSKTNQVCPDRLPQP